MKAIFFEGMNLSGKSSIMADVKSRLVKEGFIVAPERDYLCEPFRKLMHEKESSGEFKYLMALSAAADFKDSMAFTMKKLYRDDAILLVNRWSWSRYVFNRPMLKSLNDELAMEAVGINLDYKPDLLVYLQVSAECIVDRLRVRRRNNQAQPDINEHDCVKTTQAQCDRYEICYQRDLEHLNILKLENEGLDQYNTNVDAIVERIKAL